MSREAIHVAPAPAAGAVSDQALLFKHLDSIGAQVTAELDSSFQSWEARDHTPWNWASEIGHPCQKHLVHCRLDWKKKQPMDAAGHWRVEEGIDVEWKMKKKLGDIGRELAQSQRSFQDDAAKIRGRIDGFLPLNTILPAPFDRIREVPAEVKSINPMFFDGLDTIQDIRESRYWWIRKYPNQLNCYLKSTGIPGGFLILKTFGKRPKLIPMVFDEDLWVRDVAMAEAVNRHVEAGTYPEPIPYEDQVCGMCGFAHLCQPLKASKYTEIGRDEYPDLELYLELHKTALQFEAMHRKLIGDKKQPGRFRGVNAVIEDIVITSRIGQRKSYNVPDDIKAPYLEIQETVTTTIERVGGRLS